MVFLDMKKRMKFNNGFSKCYQLSKEQIQIETPTIMTLNSDSWEIGDSEIGFTLNFPPNYLIPKLNLKSNTDFIFVANFPMQKSLSEKFIKKQIKRENIEEFIKKFPVETIIVQIQPADSKKSLNEILHLINTLQIKNVALTNILPLLTNQRKFVNFIGYLREVLDYDVVLYLMSPIPHTLFPLFAYMGLDVFSDSFYKIKSLQEIFLTDMGGYRLDELKEKICNCKVCNMIKNYEEMRNNISLLEQHNKLIILKKIREIRQAIKDNTLRTLVEINIQTDVFGAAALKLFDQIWEKSRINRTPTWCSNKIKCISHYSYTRPEIISFQRKIRENFVIDKSKKVVIILPCSSKKPYSRSRSHQLYNSAIESASAGNWYYIQELIITSPLGVIPRQLEKVYPAAHYDIPVTGDWSVEEQKIVINQLKSLLDKIEKETTIIAHVSDEYQELCEQTEKILKKKFIYTSKNEKTTTKNSLRRLTDEIKKALKNFEQKKHHSLLDFIRKIADYQFGLEIGNEIFSDDTKVISKPNQNSKIFIKNKQIGTIQNNSGKLTISLELADVLITKRKNLVVFDGEKLEGSTLFAVGITNADNNIRPTDEVIIVNKKNELLGVGEAILSGKDMSILNSGAAVKIRQKRK